MTNRESQNTGEAQASPLIGGQVFARGARCSSGDGRNRLANATSRKLQPGKGFTGRLGAVKLLLRSLPQPYHELCVPGEPPVHVGSAEAAVRFVEGQQHHCHLLIGNGGPGGLSGFVIKVDRGHDRRDAAFGDAPSIIVRSREHVWYTHLVTQSARNEAVIAILRDQYPSAPIQVTDLMPLPYRDVELDRRNRESVQRVGIQHSDCAARFLSLLMTMW